MFSFFKARRKHVYLSYYPQGPTQSGRVRRYLFYQISQISCAVTSTKLLTLSVPQVPQLKMRDHSNIPPSIVCGY